MGGLVQVWCMHLLRSEGGQRMVPSLYARMRKTANDVCLSGPSCAPLLRCKAVVRGGFLRLRLLPGIYERLVSLESVSQLVVKQGKAKQS
jgi:hypothetical protein